MPMTKALKTRLQKLIDAVSNNDTAELWREISNRMRIKEIIISKQFKIGDEIAWADKTGVVLNVNQTTCGIRENDADGTRWTISSCMLTKTLVIK